MSNIKEAYKEKFLFTGLKIKDYDINNANNKILNRNIQNFNRTPCLDKKIVKIENTLKNMRNCDRKYIE